MVGTRVRFSTILANTNKKFILIFGLNLQNTHALCLCCVFVNSNPMVGTRVKFSTILANTNKKIYSYFWTKLAEYTLPCVCVVYL
jgi:hypothetical protein